VRFRPDSDPLADAQVSALSKLLGNKVSGESGPQLAVANEGEEGFKVTLWMLGTKTKLALKMLRNATVDEERVSTLAIQASVLYACLSHTCRLGRSALRSLGSSPLLCVFRSIRPFGLRRRARMPVAFCFVGRAHRHSLWKRPFAAHFSAVRR
jgi:hypothetical protein